MANSSSAPIKKRILITVKTYPTLSAKYDELVCTAGFDEAGNWIRLYPIPFRKLDYDSRYSKYQWIELDIVRNSSDFRFESYRPYNYEQIQLQEKIDTDKGTWRRRKDIVLKNVFTNLGQLIEKAKDEKSYTSLAVFKPKRYKEFVIESIEREWDSKKLKDLKEKAKQQDLFSGADNPFEVVAKVPYKFSFVFEDDEGKESKMMIEDWEICQLYWNTLSRREGDERLACLDVRNKYWNDLAQTKDLYLFLGTTRQFHLVAPNPFIIIGAFYPPIQLQTTLF